MAARRWATGVVVVVSILAGGAGGAYLWKEAFPTDTAAVTDAGVSDARAADARAGRAKSKSAKKSPRGTSHPGKPRPSDDSPNDETNDDDVAVDFQPPFHGRGPGGPTYEAALASNKQEITMGDKAEPDLTDAQLEGPMQSGRFVGECGAPDSMKVTVRVAIKLGRPAGVSVSTTPPDPDIAGCIDRYVRTFSWPSSTKMDSFTTTY